MTIETNKNAKAKGVLLTTEEVAQILDVPPKTVTSWRSQLRGPNYIRLGPGKRATIRYRPEAVDQFIEEMERQTQCR